MHKHEDDVGLRNSGLCKAWVSFYKRVSCSKYYEDRIR